MTDVASSTDIRANRRARKYGRAELAARVLWSLAFPLFRMSPRPWFAWRRFLLRVFGAKIGRDVHVYPTVRVMMPWHLSVGHSSAIGEWTLLYDLGDISIGERVTISHGAHLCAGTHDYRRADLPLLKPPISVGNDAWICADAFVGPGVAVGNGAIVGARAVVTEDVPAWTIVAGNPARHIKARPAFDS
jgi:putative colanic acid biosynthesis acetyltransferase WcaF